MCFPTRDYLGQEFKKDSEVKEFALKRVPEGLTILKTDGLGARPGWVFPKPSWNFGGKWIICKDGIMETAEPLEDVAKILAGISEGAIEAEGDAVERVLSHTEKVDEAGFLELWPGDAESGIAMFKELDVNGDGFVSREEAQKILETAKP